MNLYALTFWAPKLTSFKTNKEWRCDIILFKSDWSRYPTAIVDIETPNRSFVHLALLLKEMGIENHQFPLALLNRKLVGVDPHSEHLTNDQITDISIECHLNPWYFFREVARAPAQGSGESRPFLANRANISLFWSFFNHIFYLLIQPRQTGKSFSTDILMNLLLLVLCENTDINLLTKDDNLRRKNVERLKDIRASLPPYLQQRRRDDANNGEEITVKMRGNTYSTHVPQSSPKLAYKLGRGLTTAVMHVDEPPFQANIKIALGSALGAMGAAIDIAKAAGAPYGTILTTTAGKKDDKDGSYVYEILQSAAKWTERFYDALNEEALHEMVRAHSRGRVLRINGTFDHRQLGYDDKWLKQKLEDALQEGEDASRDFFNIWTSGSESSPFTEQQAEAIARGRMSTVYTQISGSDGYITRWYIPEEEIERRMATSQVVLGMDTSEASGGDDISMVFMDIETLEVLAIGNYNETNLIKFSRWVADILTKWTNVTAIIERRSTGIAVFDSLLLLLPQRGIDPFKRLWNLVVNNYDEQPTRYREIQQSLNRRPDDIYVRYKKTFGFATSGSGMFSRSELYSTTLQNAIKRGADKMNDIDLIDQTLGLVIRNGRIDHQVGYHDDLVIGWLLCHWFVLFGKNLSYYGIDPTRVATRVVKETELTREEAWRRYEQEELRSQIESLYQDLVNETDSYISSNLERQLQHLSSKLILEDNDIFSIDELIRSVRETKRQQRRLPTQQSHYQDSWRPTPQQQHYAQSGW